MFRKRGVHQLNDGPCCVADIRWDLLGSGLVWEVRCELPGAATMTPEQIAAAQKQKHRMANIQLVVSSHEKSLIMKNQQIEGLTGRPHAHLPGEEGPPPGHREEGCEPL